MAEAERPLPESPPPTAEQIEAHRQRMNAAREELDALDGVHDGLQNNPQPVHLAFS